MKWFGLAFLVVAIIVGVQIARAGLNPDYRHGEIYGQLRVWHKDGDHWDGEMIVDAGHMKRRFGDWTRTFPFVVTDPAVAEQIEAANEASGTIEVEYRQWRIKPARHSSDLTVVAAVPVVMR
jgi:hypothetical protein